MCSTFTKKEQSNSGRLKICSGKSVRKSIEKGTEIRPLKVNSFLTVTGKFPARARMHHKVVGNFGREADVRSLYYRRFRFNEASDDGACTHDRLAK